jgi:hypothetical protein
MGLFKKYAIEMASGGMIYIPSSMMIGTGIRTILLTNLDTTMLALLMEEM